MLIDQTAHDQRGKERETGSREYAYERAGEQEAPGGDDRPHLPEPYPPGIHDTTHRSSPSRAGLSIRYWAW